MLPVYMMTDKCPNCDAEISSSDKRCSKCGQELKKNFNFKAVGIILVIAIIAVIAIFSSGILSGDNSQNNVNSANDSVVFLASSQTNKFHKPDCEWAGKIKDNNKIVYHSREAAINDGKLPCGECNP